ncbi:peptidoglycan-binding domain-containing protein [Mycolicibacterium fortuitum]|uniref:peptidoglycan-binding domain-containing protein n=1 Tax=Mycolicibacterium fortuitum TaxID=1766 RepID=UPI0007EA3543|nr:peptidoglycan-binding domain-containing protein [Mycolicibacterium fortuitum]NOQ61786.1 peptidoglycan-binding protein [Mycolicibacterium fortuitum]OBB01103.1 hypothetical protein A5668_25050 [Mycolicibacterium fortuitum]OBB45780.1 hypothetical protein A5754_09055 [Mycolicibacterium fortuitum]OBB52926.1 hypothetical protein A5755_03380 [Mycolicibacterium fortuitum]OBF78547.1 hypothetical protein A5751_21355 [Mycolicibacterium fortuitum]
MIIGGAWVGLGLGDVDPEIARFKSFLLRKFAWVRATALDESEYFDDTTVAVVIELQRRYGMPQSGIVNYALKVRCGFITPAPAVKPMLFTVCGTGVPWWVGPDADVARAVEDRYRWQPVGYRAAPFPMWPSITEGRDELVRLINLFEGDINLIGYSQGAVVVGQVWKHDILPTNGRLHHRLPDVKKVVTFGNPMRELGHYWPDGGGAPARPTTAGILEDRIEDTPDFWRDYAHAGDIYTDCEMDDEGEYKRAIGKIVMGSNVFGGSDSILAQVIELGLRPIPEAIAAVKALIDAGTFFGSQTRDHVNYQTGPAIDFLRS